MIDPNKGASESVLRRLEEASYENFRLQLLSAVEKLLEDFDMTWDEFGDSLICINPRKYIGEMDISLKDLNEIAAVFSAEPYIIFKPRQPWTTS